MLKRIFLYAVIVQTWLIVNITNRWFNVVSDVYQKVFALLLNNPTIPVMYSTSMFDWLILRHKRKLIESLFTNARVARLLHNVMIFKSESGIIKTFISILTNTLTLSDLSYNQTYTTIMSMLGIESNENYFPDVVMDVFQIFSGQNFNDQIVKTIGSIEANLNRIHEELEELKIIIFNVELAFLVVFFILFLIAFLPFRIGCLLPGPQLGQQQSHECSDHIPKSRHCLQN